MNEKHTKGNMRKRKFWYILMLITAVVYMGWRLFFTLPLNAGVVSVVAGLALFISELLSYLEAIIHMRFMSMEESIPLPDVPPELYPEVDVLVATHSEETELLKKTLNGCRHMEYPDKSKVHIWLCDDTARPDMAALAKRLGVGYFGISGSKDAKAGNLNNALSQTHSPLVVTFDSDMIPRREFLMKTVPYFFLPKMIEEDGVWRMRTEKEIDPDYKIGFVQTPQSFYNPDMFQFNFFAETNIPNEQDFFFREVNIGRNASNSAIYAGSNTVISREALEEVGGIRTGTITEDFATGIDIQAAGYTTYAIDTVLASGLAPADFSSLLKQRQRWGRGCVQTVRSLHFWKNKLSLAGKLSYLSCLFYWWTFIRRFVYILSPILFVLFQVQVVRCSLLTLACVWLPSYLIYNHTLKLLSGKIRNQRWSNIVDTIICPYMIIPVLLETVGIHMKKFTVTSKERLSSGNTRFYFALPHIVLLLASVVGVGFCIWEMILDRSLGSLVVLFWLFMNGYFLLMAVLFMLGRVNYRSAERYYVSLPVSFPASDGVVSTATSDISENGFSFWLDFPRYVSPLHDTEFTFEDRGIRATVQGKAVHVEQRGDRWKYSVRLTVDDSDEYLEYLQIAYDRDPSLATEIKSSAYKEFSIFVKRKTASNVSYNRKLPRIAMTYATADASGNPVTVTDFNYQFITVDGLNEAPKAQVRFGELLLDLEWVDLGQRKTNLYEVAGWEEVSPSAEMLQALKEITQKEEGAALQPATA